MATPVPSATPQPRPAPQTAPASRPASATPAKAISTKPVSRLSAIKRGQLRSSLRYLFYGVEGVGKSSLAADAPNALFLDVEGGADNIDVARYPFRVNSDGTVPPDGHIPRTYEEVLGAIEDLIANPGHGHETLVIDTVDALEALIHRYLCEQNKKSGIEDFGFGKGYKAAVEELRRFLVRLDAVRAQGIQIILLGHSFVSTFKNPEGEDFDRYQLHVHKDFAGQTKEWCDVVGFVRFEGGASKITGDESRSKRARGWATNRRLVQLAREAAWDAKCRLTMPSEIELDAVHPWQPFSLAAMGARNADTKTLTDAVLVELDRIGADEFTTAAGTKTSRQSVIDLVAKSDPSTISRIVAGLQATQSLTSQES